MKLYIDNRKVGDKYEKAMTVYSDNGKLLYSAVGKIREEGLKKFDKALLAMEWGIRKFRMLCMNGELNEKETTIIFINSQTIYDWIEKENSPVQYTDIFTNIMTELSLFITVPEVICSETSRALFKNTEESSQKVTDLFK